MTPGAGYTKIIRHGRRSVLYLVEMRWAMPRPLRDYWYLFACTTFLLLTTVAAMVVPPGVPPANSLLLIAIVSLASAVVTVPAALVFAHNQLIAWSETLPTFLSCTGRDPIAIFHRELRFFRGTKGMYTFGLGLGL